MRTGSWRGFCLVGFGGHAATKLVPALQANGQELRAVVSRKPSAELPNVPIYRTVDAALAALPRDVVLLIASPPAAHFEQVLPALTQGRDVIVEKPAFVAAHEVRSAAEAAQASGAVLVEAFMHRHSALYARFYHDWQTLDEQAIALAIRFVVPRLPAGTFRQSDGVANSVLYDIGSYALALLADLRLPPNCLAIDRIGNPGGDQELLHLSGQTGAIQITVEVGVGPEYVNSVDLQCRDGAGVHYSPFFYGRAGERKIQRIEARPIVPTERLMDENAFEAMLQVPRDDWVATQGTRMARLETVTSALESLSEELASVRLGCA